MKILWVCGFAVGALAESQGIKLTSGQWINAEIENEKRQNINDIFICTSDILATRMVDQNVTYIVLPHGKVSKYQVTEENISGWEALINEINPDRILVWGTEYEISRCCLLANKKNIPSVVYVQGVMQSIAENYRGGLSDEKIKKMTTAVEKIRRTTIFDVEKKYFTAAVKEKEIINLSGRIVVENAWAYNQYKKINNDVVAYWNRLPLREEFKHEKWTEKNNHMILTTSATYPLKGLHVLIDALKIVSRKYPDVKLYIPGHNYFRIHGVLSRLKQSGYCKMISKKIMRDNLQNNIVFTGPLQPEAYAKMMSECEMFVSASAVENHGSAIREAMSVGVPCVCSAVGGVVDFAKHDINCKLFDFPNSECLANEMLNILDNSEIRIKLSNGAKQTINYMYVESPMDKLSDIYEQMKMDVIEV